MFHNPFQRGGEVDTNAFQTVVVDVSALDAFYNRLHDFVRSTTVSNITHWFNSQQKQKLCSSGIGQLVLTFIDDMYTLYYHILEVYDTTTKYHPRQTETEQNTIHVQCISFLDSHPSSSMIYNAIRHGQRFSDDDYGNAIIYEYILLVRDIFTSIMPSERTSSAFWDAEMK